MINNLNLNLNNDNHTYFIHVKKSNFKDLNDFEDIKKILEKTANKEISLNDIKFINKSELINKSYKNIGRYLKSNKISSCNECDKEIYCNEVFKQLACNHRFHTYCIDPILKKDIYKKCSFCENENITMCL
jgi:hypothetical protein